MFMFEYVLQFCTECIRCSLLIVDVGRSTAFASITRIFKVWKKQKRGTRSSSSIRHPCPTSDLRWSLLRLQLFSLLYGRIAFKSRYYVCHYSMYFWAYFSQLVIPYPVFLFIQLVRIKIQTTDINVNVIRLYAFLFTNNVLRVIVAIMQSIFIYLLSHLVQTCLHFSTIYDWQVKLWRCLTLGL